MKSVGFLLACEGHRFRAARVEADGVQLGGVTPEDPAAEDAMEQLAALLGEWGYQGRGICLGLPSQMVLAAQIDRPNLPRRDRRTAMLFCLEEQFPLEAERLTADFMPPIGGRTLGVAVETAPVRAIIDRLAAAGIETGAVCPTALLALWGRRQGQSGRSDFVVIAGPASVDVFRMAGDDPCAWYTISPDAAQLTRCIEAQLLANPVEAGPPKVTLLGQPDGELVRSLEQDASVELTRGDQEPPVAAAARAAGQLLAGKCASRVNLRRGDLAMENPLKRLAVPLRSALALGLVLLVALAVMFCWRGARYDRTTRRLEDRQAAEFQRLYPNQATPTNVKSRLSSELARHAGVSGEGLAVPGRPSALEVLRRAMAALPPAVRLRIQDMRVGPNGILVEGQVRNHSDAQIISQALTRGGFAMDPPRTEHLVAGGVAFTLVGKLTGETQFAGLEGSGP